MSETGPVVPEAVVRLIADGATVYEWRCTPTDLIALAIGRLYADRQIRDATVAERMTVRTAGDEFELHVAGALRSEPGMRVRVPRSEIPTADQFSELFRELFAGVDARHEEGGMHAAALARGGRIAFQAEDVGRHNAVDKVLGMALLERADIAAHGMLISSRVSGEIARKAAQSVVAWLASRSIPTTLAVSLARLGGMPIIGRAAGKNAYVYR